MGEIMNAKGIFFTFIVFLLALAVIFSSSGIKQTKTQQRENIIDETAFNTVNSRFQNIYGEIFIIKTGYAGRQQARILPFNYDAGNTVDGKGWVQMEQNFPLESGVGTALEKTYDALNLYSVFVSDKANSLDLTTTATAAKNSLWGGSDTGNLGYTILPQCVLYGSRLTDDNQFLKIFEADTQPISNCISSFSYSKINSVDLNITVDANMVIKTNSGGTGDLNDNLDHPFDPENPNPYVRIHIKVPNCQPHGGCDVCCYLGDTKEKVIANHITVNASGEPTKQNGLELQLETGAPISFAVLDSNYVGQKAIAVIENNTQPNIYKTKTKITFKNKIDNLIFNGFTFEVSKTGFDNLKRGS